MPNEWVADRCGPCQGRGQTPCAECQAGKHYHLDGLDLCHCHCGCESPRARQDDVVTERLDRRTWLLGIAEAIGKIADCSRRTVGALIYDPDTFHVLAQGYNGLAAGVPGCLTEAGCPRGRMTADELAPYAAYTGNCEAIHAEDNALRRAREHHIDVTGAWVAVTDEPCEGCYALLRHYKIAGVIWPGGERNL